MTLEAEHNLRDEIMIKAIQMKGTIDSISWDISGLQYRVVYWNDSQRYSTWMYSHEIEPIGG
jgi:hypothetical protein